MKRVMIGLVLPVLLGTASPALAQSAAQCAAMEGDVERLACYDTLFRNGSPAGEALSATVESEQLIPARPSGRAPATITVSCDASVLQVAFGFAGNTLSALGNDAGITLQYDLQRRSNTLPVNDDNTALVIANTRDSLAFLDALAGANNLTARVTPASARTLSARFGAQALREAAAPVVAACTQ